MLRPLIAAVALACAAAPAAATSFDVIAFPGLRFTAGSAWHLDPERDGVLAIDVLPCVQVIDMGGELYTTILAGYGYEGSGDTHLFVAGLDVGWLPDRYLGTSIGLRGVIGSADGDFGGGMRVVAGLDLWYGVFRLEAAYQLLGADPGTSHDVRVSGGVDLLRLIAAPFLAAFDNL